MARRREEYLKQAEDAVSEYACMGVSEALMNEIVSDAVTDAYIEVHVSYYSHYLTNGLVV